MTRPSSLPAESFAPLNTRRLSRPVLLWQDERARGLGFDAERIFCGPADGDAAQDYVDETRVEWADRYGGIGVGAAGGSGRCASFGDLQTKGVGATPLVAHNADAHHSSGAQTALSALVETVFAQVFEVALPFGAVPTLAVLLTRPPGDRGSVRSNTRALTVRPFVLRPAHFMRNLLNQDQRRAQGELAPGLTRDTYRVTQALTRFTQGLQSALGLAPADPTTTIDNGLRELTTRLACQFAASFAKRLPHGSVSCSNVSLSGQFLDYGMAHALPTYRRPADAQHDPWTESQRGLQTVVLLREQLEKYYPGLRANEVISKDELTRLYGTVLERRLGIEMAKMAGLTEDLALACPEAHLSAWLQVMRRILVRGGEELLVPREPNSAWTELPVDPLRPDLNRVLAASAGHGQPQAMDQSIAPLLADAELRSQFVHAAMAVRQALRPTLGHAAGALEPYLSVQARRKNAVLPELERDSWFRIGVVAQMLDGGFQPAAVQALLDGTLSQARHTLADLAPDLAGANGVAQVQDLAGRRVDAVTALTKAA
ncbi:MAG TPA: hypothetical protein VIN03_26215 [Roseateles sp.]